MSEIGRVTSAIRDFESALKANPKAAAERWPQSFGRRRRTSHFIEALRSAGRITRLAAKLRANTIDRRRAAFKLYDTYGFRSKSPPSGEGKGLDGGPRGLRSASASNRREPCRRGAAL
jgi:hypothetical protein